MLSHLLFLTSVSTAHFPASCSCHRHRGTLRLQQRRVTSATPQSMIDGMSPETPFWIEDCFYTRFQRRSQCAIRVSPKAIPNCTSEEIAYYASLFFDESPHSDRGQTRLKRNSPPISSIHFYISFQFIYQWAFKWYVSLIKFSSEKNWPLHSSSQVYHSPTSHRDSCSF